MKSPHYVAVTPTIIDQISQIVGSNQVSTAESERLRRSHDVSAHHPHLSDVIIWPHTALQTAQVLRLANEYTLPATPWGAGASVEGNPIPVYGGILLSFKGDIAI